MLALRSTYEAARHVLLAGAGALSEPPRVLQDNAAAHLLPDSAIYKGAGLAGRPRQAGDQSL